jgi:hypothetical protein
MWATGSLAKYIFLSLNAIAREGSLDIGAKKRGLQTRPVPQSRAAAGETANKIMVRRIDRSLMGQTSSLT